MEELKKKNLHPLFNHLLFSGGVLLFRQQQFYFCFSFEDKLKGHFRSTHIIRGTHPSSPWNTCFATADFVFELCSLYRLEMYVHIIAWNLRLSQPCWVPAFVQRGDIQGERCISVPLESFWVGVPLLGRVLHPKASFCFSPLSFLRKPFRGFGLWF